MKHWKLKKDKISKGLYAVIKDEEGDELRVDFDNDMCAKIDTSKVEFIYLNNYDLIKLSQLAIKAEKKYRKNDN